MVGVGWSTRRKGEPGGGEETWAEGRDPAEGGGWVGLGGNPLTAASAAGSAFAAGAWTAGSGLRGIGKQGHR